MDNNKLDLIIYGASSFVGQIVTQALAQHCTQHNKTLQWGIAGRSETKLTALKQSLGSEFSAVPIILADATKPTQLQQMCDQTSTIISTVGPYALYGESLIKACVEKGTDYCDLSGEVQWMHKMIDQYEPQAQASGARIVHCCGFDSIPSDMGVYFLQQQAQQAWGKPATRVTMRVKAAKGGVSGGTVASLMNGVAEAAQDSKIRKILTNPYSLCLGKQTSQVKQHSVKSATYDQDFNAWVAPFVMAGINESVVHRSNFLTDNAYSEAFIYNEAILMQDGLKGRLKALATTAALGGFMLGATTKPLRKVMQKYILPKSGEGPSEDKQTNGYFNLQFCGKAATGETLNIQVTGDQDPGYGATSKMLCQAGLSLCQDQTNKQGGFWTPAALFDDRFVKRLTDYAGLKFAVVEVT